MLKTVNCHTSSPCASPHWSNTQSASQRGLFHAPLMSPGISSFVNHMDRTNQDSERESPARLKEEIATLELELIHSERRLLSLYRTAFEGKHLSTLPSTPISDILINTRSLSKFSTNQKTSQYESHLQRNSSVHHNQTSIPCSWTSSCAQTPAISLEAKSRKSAASGRHSLAYLLGSSSIHETFSSPDKLSEDIVRGISSIYCKLANPPQSRGASLASPPPSLSSSSTLSSADPCDSWSPRCNEDTKAQHQGFTNDSIPYATMIEVLKICLDDNSFKYAATMLLNFRSLVRKLEDVDPRKMKREEKLAFWINIHNALIMQAYLAYGTCNRVKSASILKAAYNIGGRCINAFVIQSSILGIRSHYSAPWLQTLFPAKRYKAGSIRHEYALEYPEPLVHFALCSGAYSDPSVRAYTANNIFHDLKLARDEYIQAGVYIHKETKIFLPKILYYFEKDMSQNLHELMRLVIDSLPKVQKKAIERCMKGRELHKCIHWLPQSSTFRYIIHKELAKGS